LVVDTAGVTIKESELVIQAQAGRLAAFGTLISHYQERLYALALRLTGSDDDAAEIVQETFLRALKAIRQFKRKSTFYTWLVRIMINLVNDQRDRKRRESQYLTQQKRVVLEGSQAGRLLDLGDPAGAMQARETSESVHRALETLDPDHKQALVLRELEQFSYKQIAEMLEISEGTVKSRLFRARESLRKSLAHYLDDG